MRPRPLWLLLAALLGALWMPPSVRATPGLRRFVLAVAADDGGSGRERLRYAADDAHALTTVLRELGGVDATDVASLRRPSPSALRESFAQLAARVRAAASDGARTEVVFYYSGHSDETALLLARERLDYAELRRLLDALPADVRIAILDSCASGALTRLKGGRRRPAFLVDGSTAVRGHAFLTSASADEAAQESDRIGGSFFTHYLVSGLRGAADASGDGKISLTELYRFAFDETLARTAQTQYGSQHPAYEIRLAGTGDLVLTDLRTTSAELSIEPPVEGRLFVWDAHDKLLVEVHKLPGQRLVLAVPPGGYRVELTRGAMYFVGTVEAAAGQPVALGPTALREVAREETRARGLLTSPTHAPVGAALVPRVSTNHRGGARLVRNNLSLAFGYDDPVEVDGLQLSLLASWTGGRVRGVQLAPLLSGTSELRGLQIGGVSTVARRAAIGAQLSLGLNLAVALRGVQVGAVSWAGDAFGTQLGGINVTRDLAGLQLGLLNVAAGQVSGMQLGLINYADSADVSLGVIALTRQGGAHAQVLVTDLFAPQLSLRLDARYNYSFVSFAVAPYGSDEGYALGGGLGAKLPLGLAWLWLDVDLGGHWAQRTWHWERSDRNVLVQLRALARIVFAPHLAISLGPTLNLLVPGDRGSVLRSLFPGRLGDGEREKQVWVGFAAGLTF